MSEPETEDEPPPSLNLSKTGSWKGITSICRDVGSILRSAKPEELDENLSEDELDALCEEWENWRPESADDFSDEMIEKTAKQSSVGESELEKEEREPSQEMKKAGESIAKAAEDAEEEGLGEAKGHLSDAVKSAGQAIDSKIRQGIRNLEEKIYESVILKANSLYFDNSALNAVLSERRGADESERYRLTLHSNSPSLRKFLAERIDWDDC